MIKLSNNKDKQNIELTKIVSLLIHAAKIDENYTDKEKDLINNFINKFSEENSQNKTSSEIFEEAQKQEKDIKNNARQLHLALCAYCSVSSYLLMSERTK